MTKLELYPTATKSMYPLFRNSGMHPEQVRPSSLAHHLRSTCGIKDCRLFFDCNSGQETRE